MIAYLFRCLMILVSLWAAQYFHIIPWSGLINIGITIVVPIGLIAFGMRRTALDIIRRANGGKMPTTPRADTVVRRR